MIKAILFDFDGVIVDTFSFCYEINSFGDDISHDEYRSMFEGNIHDALHKHKDTSRANNFFSLYDPKLMKCDPENGMEDVIKELAKKYPLLIISSTTSPSIERYLEARELRQYFKEVLGCDVERSKVKKIQRVLETYSIKPTETVFITDTLGDIREAEKCGVESIAVTWGYHPRETLKTGNPKAIIDTPADILKEVQ